MNKLPFNQRFGERSIKPIDNDFPDTARIALFNLVKTLEDRGYILDEPWEKIRIELLRTGRIEYREIDESIYILDCRNIISDMEWFRIYIFCERLYENLLCPKGFYSMGDFIETENLEQVREFYTKELNNLLLEENIAFKFELGEFTKPGRAQTNKNLMRANSVLIDPKLRNVKTHYIKAQKYFNQKPEPDNENCIKEAICALESCLDILSGEGVSKDFTKNIKKFGGTTEDKIPMPIIDSMIKIYSYRGAGIGIAHGNIKGLRVTNIETELIISLVATYITYLVDHFELLKEDTIPF